MEYKKNTIAKTVALSFVLGIASCSQAQNNNTSNPAPGKAFAVVELFTSEGCSSCPPADTGWWNNCRATIPMLLCTSSLTTWITGITRVGRTGSAAVNIRTGNNNM